jgi:hypothetical protein
MGFAEDLLAVPPDARDGWFDDFLGVTDPLPADGALAQGNVPYLPCGVATLLAAIEHAHITADDVFVDIGSGWGRATAFVHAMTGARTIGVEVQPHLVKRARDLGQTVLEGDAVEIVRTLHTGTVFFLYCPFSGERLRHVLGDLEAIARAHPLRICAVDLPLPRCPWLEPIHTSSASLYIARGAGKIA